MSPAGLEIPVAWRLRGRLEAAALEAALNDVRRRHSILRTSFRMRRGVPVQVVDPPLRTPLDVTDVQHLPFRNGDHHLRSLIDLEARRSDGAAGGRMVRWHLVRHSDEEHVLFFVAHRAVFDRRSRELLSAELERSYGAALGREETPEEAPSIHYSDYARWQRAWMRDEVLQEISDWWRRRLAGTPTRLNLPVDRHPTSTNPGGSSSVREWLPPGLRGRVSALARSSGTAPATVYLAAFLVAMHRYTGETDLAVGIPRDGRILDDLQGLLGPFGGFLILRNDLAGDPTFRELLHRIEGVSTDARDHGHLPLTALLGEGGGVVLDGDDPLPQLFFGYEGTARRLPRLPDLEVSEIELATPSRGGDLELVVEDHDGDPHLGLTYDVRRFDRIPASRMLRHVLNVLEEALEGLGLRLSNLPVLDESERRRVVVEWARHHPYRSPTPELLHDVVKRRIRAAPEKAAIVGGGRTISGGELLERARKVALGLRARGVRPGVPVGLCAERSVDAVVATLGILEAGGVWVPLDPNRPPWTLFHVFAAASVDLVLTTPRCAEALPGAADIDVVSIGTVEREGEDARDPTLPGSPSPAARASDPFAIFHHPDPCGDVGRTVVRHEAAASFVRSMSDVPGLRPDDRFLALTDFSSEHSILEIFLPLIGGATLVLAPDDDVERPDRLVGRLEREGVTAVLGTPDRWRGLLYAGRRGLGGIRGFCVGEDPLELSFARRLVERLDSVCILYSPRGAGTWPLRHLLDPEDLEDDPVPAGRPVAHGRAYVLDGYGDPVPVGVTGELWVGGWDDGGAEDAEEPGGNGAGSRMRDPFAADGAWIHGTGRRARWRRDGSLTWET